MEALEDLSYKHVTEIKFYKTEMADEGVKYVCKFVEKVKSA